MIHPSMTSLHHNTIISVTYEIPSITQFLLYAQCAYLVIIVNELAFFSLLTHSRTNYVNDLCYQIHTMSPKKTLDTICAKINLLQQIIAPQKLLVYLLGRYYCRYTSQLQFYV